MPGNLAACCQCNSTQASKESGKASKRACAYKHTYTHTPCSPGTSLYNELLRSCLPPPASAEETDEDDVEQGESYNLVNGAYNALPSGPDGPGEASRLAGPARPPRKNARVACPVSRTRGWLKGSVHA
eukprot:810339-Pelagomonas_calceolata.AAC.1